MNEIFKNGFEIFDDNAIRKIPKIINKTIQSQTKNYIRNPIKLSVLGYVEIVLMTILRFNRQFQKLTPQPDTQSTSTESDEWECKSFFYKELSTFVGEFPYDKSNVSLFILLPALVIPNTKYFKLSDKNSSLNNLIKRLSTNEGICELRKLLDNDIGKDESKNYKDFQSWPIFELEKNVKIQELLQALGLEQLLKSNAIDLYKLFTRDDQKVQYGNVVHRVHVKVTEKNTVAGAMTLLTGHRSLPNLQMMKQ
ncbi:uncharacterized protein LOC114935398 isoform X2 [Nylanderia fulva]|uniref:uncharacterized protein LOC114935398 isoform X2 n=1 Tax=Nylanderia fulva TaxID=613905 RepID=UPI0010FB020E|nr:uncharacterized protein LOC114935398 isoform X2 [Nylanderia fulva]